MRKRKLRIYLDTSVISYYTARPHADPLVRSRQSATRRWWEASIRTGDVFISSYVIEEIGRGDPAAARKRLEAVEGFRKLYPTPGVERLAAVLLHRLGIPRHSHADAAHLAIAAMNGQDYIVSWNFRHMANANVRAIYRRVCREEGLRAPGILTPEDMPGGGGSS